VKREGPGLRVGSSFLLLREISRGEYRGGGKRPHIPDGLGMTFDNETFFDGFLLSASQRETGTTTILRRKGVETAKRKNYHKERHHRAQLKKSTEGTRSYIP